MSFLYPRTISIRRANAHAAIGAVGYGGVTEADETVVVSGLPASIQAKSGSARTRSGDLPAAAPGPVQWNIFLPKSAAANGTILDRDIVVDDLGERYMVDAAYWNSLGYQLKTIRLEAH